MTLAEEIARDLEPDPASTPTASETPATARPRRGHWAKIAEAVTELRAEAKLPPNLRPGHRDKLIQDRLLEKGYRADLPDRYAIRRYLQSER